MLGGVCRGKESEGVRGAGVKRGGGALFGGFAVCSGRSLTRIFNGNTIECALCCSVESFVTITGGFRELFGNFCPISTTSLLSCGVWFIPWGTGSVHCRLWSRGHRA